MTMFRSPLLAALLVASTVLVAQPGTAHADEPTLEDAPLQLRKILIIDAQRAQRARIYGGVFGLVGAGTTVASGAFALPAADDTFRMANASAVIVIGSLGLGGAAYGMVARSPLERLADSYGPVALDLRIPAEDRLFTGEQGLREAARMEQKGRRIEGVTNIVVGVALGGLALSLASASSFTPTERMSLTSFSAVSAFMSVGSGIGHLWFERSGAELALEHWQTTRSSWPSDLGGGYVRAY